MKRRGFITTSTALIIGGIIAGFGYGGKKAVDAIEKNKEAEIVIQNAVSTYDTAKNSMEAQRDKTSPVLERLGRVKLRCWADDIGGFVTAFQKFHNVELTGDATFDELKKMPGGVEQSLQEMRQNSLTALQLTSGLGASVGAGMLAGFATKGMVAYFGAASTGIAIKALSGIAAKNAILAWLGGGTIATGGMGVAGGTLVLGGVFLAPFAALGGYLYDSHAEANLEEARKYLADAREKSAEMRVVETTLINLRDLSQQCEDFIREFSPRFQFVIRNMNVAYANHCGFWNKMIGLDVQVDFRTLTKKEQYTLQTGWLMAQTLKKLMEAPLLDDNGYIDDQIKTILVNCDVVANSLPKPEWTFPRPRRLEFATSVGSVR